MAAKEFNFYGGHYLTEPCQVIIVVAKTPCAFYQRTSLICFRLLHTANNMQL